MNLSSHLKGSELDPRIVGKEKKKTGRSSDKHIETEIDRQSHTHIYTYKDDGYKMDTLKLFILK